MRALVKILVGLLVGVVVAPRMGVGAGIYLWSVVLAVALSVLLIMVLGIFLMLRAGRNVDIQQVSISAVIVASLVVDWKLGFSLAAIIAFAIASLMSRFCCDMIWPTYEEA